jgi:RNA polymerase sigma factor (TIGR02999 family)
MSGEVTRLLEDIQRGDPRATEELLPLVYAELRRLAAARMARETPGHTLEPTALVHEAYLRLVGGGDVEWSNRGHFFAAAAEAMRRILIERARRSARVRHGGGQRRVELPTGVAGSDAPDLERLLALDQALSRLEARDPEMARVAKLRHFAGLTVDETALAMGVSPRSVNRLWTAARAWLGRELG